MLRSIPYTVKKCALTGREIGFDAPQTASLDRIDSTKGYLSGNVQWVHVSVNRMKNSFSQNEFIATCTEVAEWARITKAL